VGRCVVVDFIVSDVFRVVDLGVDPGALVVGVGDGLSNKEMSISKGEPSSAKVRVKTEQTLGVHSPLKSGFLILGASQSPSMSSSQSSGFVASGSTMYSGRSSYPSGFLSSGSAIVAASTQSSG
jgi:hypothetical protein